MVVLVSTKTRVILLTFATTNWTSGWRVFYFATSHGKSACGGIGGTVKRLSTKASLQRPYTDPILTSEVTMEFCTKNIPGIHFFNIPPEDSKAWHELTKEISSSCDSQGNTAILLISSSFLLTDAC